MSKRAEEIANRLYPPRINGNGWTEWDENEKYRKGCIEGYEQAEEDTLVWMENRLGDIIGSGDKSEVISAFKRYMEE